MTEDALEGSKLKLTEEIIELTVQQANLAHPERKISIAFGFSNHEEKLKQTDENFAMMALGAALLQYRGTDFDLLFGGPLKQQQISLWLQLKPDLIIERPCHWESLAMICSDFESPGAAMAVPLIEGASVRSLAYPHFPLDGFKWWFIADICDKLLRARDRLQEQW